MKKESVNEDKPKSFAFKLQTVPNANSNIPTCKVVDLKETRNINKQKKLKDMQCFWPVFAFIVSSTY